MKIKSWHRFQHFKDRRPPWIKLYRDILDDPEWFALSGDDAKALIMLWLIASEDENGGGYLPDIKTISFRLRTTSEKVKTAILRLNHWILADDINMISSRCQHDTPETETETETETEKARARKRFSPPTIPELKTYASEIGLAQSEAENMHDYYAAKGWTVGKSPMKDWKAAARKWARNAKEYSASSNGQSRRTPEGRDI